MASSSFSNGLEPLILGSGEAYPTNTYTQQEFLDALLKQYPMNADSSAFAERIFPATGIKCGNIALPKEQLFRRMKRGEFVEYIRNTTCDMAERAALSALQSWGGSLSDITHIILGTMSAVIDAPTFDARLINSLRLPSNVRRLAVQQMGCLTGFRCLSTAAELAAANPGARVLVVVADVRSGLQNQLPRWDPQEGPSRACIISCALFRDAASAVVVGAGPRPHEAPSARILKTASAFLPDTLEYVAIKDLDDETISWHNSKHLPDAVSGAVPPLVSELLSSTGLAASDTAFAMHPGGPKVLQLTAKALALPDAAFEVSWQFLAEHGNTSGSSNLALLHNELHRPGSSAAPRTRHIMCLGIGPGLALEGLLLARCGWEEGEAAVVPEVCGVEGAAPVDAAAAVSDESDDDVLAPVSSLDAAAAAGVVGGSGGHLGSVNSCRGAAAAAAAGVLPDMMMAVCSVPALTAA